MSDSDITIERGVNCGIIFESYSDDAMTTRTDWTGMRAVFQARSQRGATDTILNLASDDNSGKLLLEDATDGPAGKWVRLALTAAHTTAITEPGVYELVQVQVAAATQIEPVVAGALLLVDELIE